MQDNWQLLKIIAYLAHPHIDIPKEMYNEYEKNEYNLNKIYDILKTNKVLLHVINHLLGSSSLTLKRDFIKALTDDQRPFRESYKFALLLKQELMEVAKALKENNVKLIFIKSFNSLPLDSDNFDILVKEQDLIKARDILRKLGFVEVMWIQEPYKWLFRRIREGKDYVAIHLHTRVAWEGVEFVDLSDLWQRRREVEVDGVMVGMPSPEHHLLITISHSFFENHDFKLSDLIYIIEDVQYGVDWDYIIKWVDCDRWLKPFYVMLQLAEHLHESLFMRRMIAREEFERLEEKGKMHRIDLAERLIKRFDEKPFLPIKISITTVALQYIDKIFASTDISPFKVMTTVSSLVWQFIKRRMFGPEKQPTFLICFSGQDGTGKTTHATQLWKELKKRGIKVNYVWSRGSGLSFEPLLRLVRWLMLGSKFPTSESKYVNRRENLLRREPLRSLWAYSILIDHLLQVLKVRLLLLFRYIVVCDRYLCDTLVDVKCDLRKNMNNVLEEIFENLAPKPKIAFLLDTEPKEIIKIPKALRCKRSVYLNYANKRKFTIINTKDFIERNKEKILYLVLKTYYSN